LSREDIGSYQAIRKVRGVALWGWAL
jgi:hypothetical protein